MAKSPPKTLRFLTWNVNGLKNALDQKRKRWSVLNRINKAKSSNKRKDKKNQLCRLKELREEMNEADVVFLQETKIVKGQTDVFKKFSEWRIYYTEYEKDERGVAIFINNRIEVEDYDRYEDKKSAFIVVHCCLNDQPYTLVNVYHHQDDENTLSDLSDHLQRKATGLLVIGGDFNTVFSPFIDKKEPTVNSNHSIMMKRLEPFMRSLQLVDVWRWRHPQMRFYTFWRTEKSSRLDYFFVPEELLWRVQACEIEDVPTNDHLPVSLHLNNICLNYCETPVDPFKYDLSNQGDVRRLNEDVSNDIQALQISDTDGQKTKPVDTSVTIEDIEMTIKSLQVSDTPRKDGIHASEYKKKVDNTELLTYLRLLYSRILDGSFDANSNNFNDYVSSPFHFFNVDYVILASILARKLEEVLKSQSGSHKVPNYDTHVAVIYSFLEVPQSVDRSVLKKALDIVSHYKDFMDICTILKMIPYDSDSQKYLLCEGCPLTPFLRSLLLTYVVRNDLKKHSESDTRIHGQNLDQRPQSVTKIHVYRYFVNAIVGNDGPLGQPETIVMDEMHVFKNFATSVHDPNYLLRLNKPPLLTPDLQRRYQPKPPPHPHPGTNNIGKASKKAKKRFFSPIK